MKKTLPLKKSELALAVRKLPSWTLNPKTTTLSSVFNFRTHVDALVFIARVTVHAQVLDHHPEVIFTHKKVKIVLTTSEIKALTKKDIELAKRIAAIK